MRPYQRAFVYKNAGCRGRPQGAHVSIPGRPRVSCYPFATGTCHQPSSLARVRFNTSPFYSNTVVGNRGHRSICASLGANPSTSTHVIIVRRYCIPIQDLRKRPLQNHAPCTQHARWKHLHAVCKHDLGTTKTILQLRCILTYTNTKKSQCVCICLNELLWQGSYSVAGSTWGCGNGTCRASPRRAWPKARTTGAPASPQ